MALLARVKGHDGIICGQQGQLTSTFNRVLRTRPLIRERKIKDAEDLPVCSSASLVSDRLSKIAEFASGTSPWFDKLTMTRRGISGADIIFK